MKKNIKKYLIILLLLIIVALIIYAVVYAFNNYNRSDILTIDSIKEKYTINDRQLDVVKLPVSADPLIYKKLPQAKNTIQEIDYKTFKKLFLTEGKSILILTKDGCGYCKQYLPIAEKVFNDLNIKAYSINLSKLSEKNKKDIYNHIDFDGTPTTYTVVDGNAKHSLSGLVDYETLKAFIDYFYTRNN